MSAPCRGRAGTLFARLRGTPLLFAPGSAPSFHPRPPPVERNRAGRRFGW